MSSINPVEVAPMGLVIALQFWEGDKAAALRLARLMAAIEPERRTDITIAFCGRRFAAPPVPMFLSDEDHRTVASVEEKFDVMELGVFGPDGHPQGCNVLWMVAMQRLTELWQQGARFSSVFFVEPDGVPLRRDWINLLKVRHQQDILSGRRVTGPWMDQPVPHFNGSLMMHLSTWIDLPSLHSTPPAQAWDMFHAAALMSQGAPTHLVKNIYGSTQWTAPALEALARETAWLASTKDTSAIEWAETALRASSP